MSTQHPLPPVPEGEPATPTEHHEQQTRDLDRSAAEALSSSYTLKTFHGKDSGPMPPATSPTDERRGSTEAAEWLSSFYKPTEFRSQSSATPSRSRSRAGSFDTHHLSTAERKRRQEIEAKRSMPKVVAAAIDYRFIHDELK